MLRLQYGRAGTRTKMISASYRWQRRAHLLATAAVATRLPPHPPLPTSPSNRRKQRSRNTPVPNVCTMRIFSPGSTQGLPTDIAPTARSCMKRSCSSRQAGMREAEQGLAPALPLCQWPDQAQALQQQAFTKCSTTSHSALSVVPHPPPRVHLVSIAWSFAAVLQEWQFGCTSGGFVASSRVVLALPRLEKDSAVTLCLIRLALCAAGQCISDLTPHRQVHTHFLHCNRV